MLDCLISFLAQPTNLTDIQYYYFCSSCPYFTLLHLLIPLFLSPSLSLSPSPTLPLSPSLPSLSLSSLENITDSGLVS